MDNEVEVNFLAKMTGFWVAERCSLVEVYQRLIKAIALMMEAARTFETLVKRLPDHTARMKMKIIFSGQLSVSTSPRSLLPTPPKYAFISSSSGRERKINYIDFKASVFAKERSKYPFDDAVIVQCTRLLFLVDFPA